jgi:hypothetical protein
MKIVLQTYIMMCKLQRLKTTYTKGKLWVSKTRLDLLLLLLSTADRYAYNLAFLLVLMILLLLMLMTLLLLLLCDSSCLLFNLQILSSYVWKLCVRFEGSGAAGGGVEMHAQKTSLAELENARDLHGETNIHIGLHRPAHLPFGTYGS